MRAFSTLFPLCLSFLPSLSQTDSLSVCHIVGPNEAVRPSVRPSEKEEEERDFLTHFRPASPELE